MKTSLALRPAVRGGARRPSCTGLIVGLTALFLLGAPSAHAFYPLGGFDQFGVLKFITWPTSELDTNGDGEVQDGEGVPLVFESGEWGFTDGEVDTVLSGFEEWESALTSFMAFRFLEDTDDPLEVQTGLDAGAIDFLNYVAFAFDTYEPDSGQTGALGGALGISLLSFSVDDTVLEIEGRSYPITGGQMIDTDFVLSGDGFRNGDSTLTQLISLKGAAVTLSGYALGLNPSPLVNDTAILFDPSDPTVEIGLVEERVVAMPDPNGILRLVGTSSSMQEDLILVYDEELTDTREDLAPDDVAGVSFLYPRANQTNFTSLVEEARTRSRVGGGTAALEGAHIMAWCDVDNDPTTLPVPFTDTLTGLYTDTEFRRGVFDLKGLYKQLQLENGLLFEPTYILTCAPFDPPGDQEPSDFDSTHGGIFGDFGIPLDFASFFSAEVFHEAGNLLGLDSMPAGTPLVFDPGLNRFVSAESGLPLNIILPGNQPMFGSSETVCPLTLAVGKDAAAAAGLFALRNFRDDYLLTSPLGMVAVDAYYQAAPSVSSFLRAHPWAMIGTRAGFYGTAWLLERMHFVVALLLLAPLCVWLARTRARTRRIAAATGIGLVVVLAALPAVAVEPPVSTEKLVSESSDIVSGEVKSVHSYFDEKNRIFTDVTVGIDDTLKGRLNKSGRVTFRVQGGRVGAIVTYSPSLPTFREKEEVILFLKDSRSGGKIVTAGRHGKLSIQTDAVTRERYVTRSTPLPAEDTVATGAASGFGPSAGGNSASKSAGEASKGQSSAEAGAVSGLKVKPRDAELSAPKRVPLVDYKAKVRQIARKQQSAAVK